MEILFLILKIVFVLAVFLTLLVPLTWAERRMSSMIQDRLGPNRANFGKLRLWGLLHPVADVTKLMTKEDHRPTHGNRFLYLLAPVLAIAPVLILLAFIPFGGPICLEGTMIKSGAAMMCQLPTGKLAAPELLQIADLNVAILFFMAIASISVFGPILGGWASHNKYSLLGSLRTSAQVISYELIVGLAIVGVVMVTGTTSLHGIVMAQSGPIWNWGIFLQPLGFLLYLVASFAENKRAPFDLPEAESELVAGYHTEYSASKFTTFYMGEFLEVLVIAALMATLFFGGWQVPWLEHDGFHFGSTFWSIPRWLVVILQIGKFMSVMLFLTWMHLALRWTYPRFRYDQVMKLGWKMLLPLALVNIVITGVVLLAVKGTPVV